MFYIVLEGLFLSILNIKNLEHTPNVCLANLKKNIP